ncbi:T7SS effector LXG polymorphic toxin [Parvimonas sp. C2]|uniref:T7SS effector LXG polymorphic toxin n=1 Tax=Parvimonas sp. C2 TaxID=3110692 RepID=UPI002B4761EE|nr:T7SS effector LXG polymorphic toxin [Parvimonas sp. C2]MEB3072781.1 T7SS effector LXG polymorphic toxin [Parvimonas sp. C2]
MEYKIHFEDIANVQRELSNSIAIWNNSINNLMEAIKNFSDDSSLKGETMDSIKVYLCEVHGTLLVSMQNLIQDYAYSYLLYKDGYYNIDSDSKAKLSEQTFVNLRNELSYSRSNFANQIDLLISSKNKVSDLISYSGNSHDTMISNYNFLISGLDTLNSRIIAYEKLHQSQDLKLFKELLVSTKNFMENYSSKARDVSTYQSGDLAKIDFAKELAVAFDNSNRYLSNRKNIIEEADKRDKVRWKQIFAKERRNKGIKNLIVGGLTLLVGTAAIVATGGSAIPLVVLAGKICGTGTVAYSVSNMTEAAQDVIYGSLGDNKTGAINPIRDTVFLGNDKLYHITGQIFTKGSSILIPIGKTNSIVKGGFQFLAGSAGAWVGGKVGYYGLKQLGFSEENARIGQVLFSIYAGYKASQIAGRFTLNSKAIEKPIEVKENITDNPNVAKGNIPEKPVELSDNIVEKPIEVKDFNSWEKLKLDNPGKVTKFISDNKPKNAPIPKNWFEKGGSLKIEKFKDGSQIWKYTDASGKIKVYKSLTVDNSFLKLNTIVEKVKLRARIWLEDKFKRGKEIDGLRGNNLGSNYPVVDKYDDGVVTSIKSRNLSDKSYQNGKILEYTIKSDINKLKDFEMVDWAGKEYASLPIKIRNLEIVVPNISLNEHQINAINKMVEYGKINGVNLIIVVGGK